MDNSTQKSTVMHSFKDQKSSSSPLLLIIAFIVIIILGIGTGYELSKSGQGLGMISLPKVSSVEQGKVYGSSDTSTFKDVATGVLQTGGIDGEGQYHIVRPGGDSQNVYVTSSTVDLSQFVGKKVKVWGQTQASQKAGWLMDVGRVQVL